MTFETFLLLVGAIYFISTFYEKLAEYLSFAKYSRSARALGLQIPTHHGHYILELLWRSLFIVGILLRFLIL